MASWDSILKEATTINQPDAFDIVRRRKIDAVQQITGRPLVIYAADFTTQNPIKGQLAAPLMSISLTDKDGFDEVTRNLTRGTEVDIVLHSPGGSAEATESIVEILRARFSKVRFIVPNVAKSAATMLAMSGDELLLDERSELGPTDPQMILIRDGQRIIAPAQAIKDQFEKAQDELAQDPNKMSSWMPILRGYGPSLLAECDNHLALARELVSKWLAKYMFAGDSDAQQKADRIADYLANHNLFRSHSRRVGINELQGLGAKILDLRTQPSLHEAVRDLYNAIMLTFSFSGSFKIFENSKHEARIEQISINIHDPNTPPPSQPQQQPRPQPSQVAPLQAPSLNRADRRKLSSQSRKKPH